MKLLFLDDDHQRAKVFRSHYPMMTHVETAADCKAAIEKAENIGVLCLDHDLGGQHYVSSFDPECGMEVVRFLQERSYQEKIGLIVVHSLNQPAAKEMVLKLKDANYYVARISFLNIRREEYKPQFEKFMNV